MKKAGLVSLICVLLSLLCGCNLKAYSLLDSTDENGGYMLDVDGIIYRTNPIIPWKPNRYNKTTMIGVTSIPSGGPQQYGIYTYEGDTDRIFLICKEQSADPSNFYCYRDDIILPAFERRSIDSVMIGRNILDEQVNLITDAQTIDKLFDILKTYPKEKLNGHFYSVYDINFMNEKFNGVAVTKIIVAGEGKYWIYGWNTARLRDEYFELSQAFLEELAGKQMPSASDYISQFEK
jgi:hypothetical protein